MTPSDGQVDDTTITAEALRRLMLGGEARVVDIRAPSEFNGELGHVDGAKSVPSPLVLAAAVEWDKSQPIVLVCRNGLRAPRLAQELRALGFQRVLTLAGGMLAWDDAGMPVSRRD